MSNDRQAVGESRTSSGNLPAMVVMGLMSGTSADGVDAVAACLELRDGTLAWEVVGRKTAPYPRGLRLRLLDALKPETSDVSLLTQLHAEVGACYAGLSREFAVELEQKTPVELIALSGQTVYHIPRSDEGRGWSRVSTLQVGEAALVAESCRLPVLSDFRQSDMAAGGQGAPMVSFGDLLLYGQPDVSRAVHNLGGISNLTYLAARADPAAVFAFDTGPANCMMDDAAERFLGRGYDEGGRLAASGRIDEDLLESWLQHPYLQLRPPKTTGREVFELDAFLPDDRELPAADLMATLCAFSAESIARAYRDFVIPLGLDEVLLAGGGALNPTLVRMLRERLPLTVKTFAELGWDARDREALAFAVMAYFAYHGLPNTLPSATGARHAVVAGKLTDHRPRR